MKQQAGAGSRIRKNAGSILFARILANAATAGEEINQ
jgi:hypothetical protein